jgi:hypothetical protein
MGENLQYTEREEYCKKCGKLMHQTICSSIILSEVSQAQKAKSHMFFSYVEYRPNTNAAML